MVVANRGESRDHPILTDTEKTEKHTKLCVEHNTSLQRFMVIEDKIGKF